MSSYRENWGFELSSHFLPQNMRALCDASLEEIISAAPIRECQLLSVSASLLEKYPSLILDTN